MRADLRFAGLDKQVEQRLRIAAQLLHAFGINASVSPWDGTRCSVLLVHDQDAYGRRAQDIAARRKTPVLAFTDRVANTGTSSSVAMRSTASCIAARLKIVLAKQSTSGTVIRGAPGVCQIAGDETLRSGDIEASIGTRKMIIRASNGRVLATTHGDLMIGMDSLHRPGWQFSVSPRSEVADMDDHIGTNLDVFYLRGSLKGSADLPSFPQGRFGLSDWPDLGNAPDLINTLHAARVMLRNPVDVNELAVSSGLSMREANAHFWAFKASGLLRGGDADAFPATMTRKPHAFAPGLLGRIAARFGLSWR